LARATTDTFAGIRPADVPGFLAAQLLGAGCARGALGWLCGPASPAAVAVDVDEVPRRRQRA
jgi:hypothetical protein